AIRPARDHTRVFVTRRGGADARMMNEGAASRELLGAEHLIAVDRLVVGGRLPPQEDAPILALCTQSGAARSPFRRDGVPALRSLTELLRPEGAIDTAEVLVERLADVAVNAPNDGVFAARTPLLRQVGIGKQRPRHPDEVALPTLDDLGRERERSDL